MATQSMDSWADPLMLASWYFTLDFGILALVSDSECTSFILVRTSEDDDPVNYTTVNSAREGYTSRDTHAPL